MFRKRYCYMLMVSTYANPPSCGLPPPPGLASPSFAAGGRRRHCKLFPLLVAQHAWQRLAKPTLEPLLHPQAPCTGLVVLWQGEDGTQDHHLRPRRTVFLTFLSLLSLLCWSHLVSAFAVLPGGESSLSPPPTIPVNGWKVKISPHINFVVIVSGGSCAPPFPQADQTTTTRANAQPSSVLLLLRCHPRRHHPPTDHQRRWMQVEGREHRGAVGACRCKGTVQGERRGVVACVFLPMPVL